MNMKGISPLIATIMLIAFTMIVAGILAGWATQFVTTQRTEIQFCSKAQVLIQRAYWDNTSVPPEYKGTLNLQVYNTGDVPLTRFAIRLTYKNQSLETVNKDDLNLTSQQIISITIPDIPESLDQVVIQSKQCRGAQDLIGWYDIAGLGFPRY